MHSSTSRRAILISEDRLITMKEIQAELWHRSEQKRCRETEHLEQSNKAWARKLRKMTKDPSHTLDHY
jgi:hypothetical protein